MNLLQIVIVIIINQSTIYDMFLIVEAVMWDL